jgi:hypothetical protein
VPIVGVKLGGNVAKMEVREAEMETKTKEFQAAVAAARRLGESAAERIHLGPHLQRQSRIGARVEAGFTAVSGKSMS